MYSLISNVYNIIHNVVIFFFLGTSIKIFVFFFLVILRYNPHPTSVRSMMLSYQKMNIKVSYKYVISFICYWLTLISFSIERATKVIIQMMCLKVKRWKNGMYRGGVNQFINGKSLVLVPQYMLPFGHGYNQLVRQHFYIQKIQAKYLQAERDNVRQSLVKNIFASENNCHPMI